MRRAFSVAWFAVRAVYDEVFVLAGMGLIWFVVAIAVPYGLTWLARLTGSWALFVFALLLSLIPIPPVTGALYSVASHIARDKPIAFSTFWRGFGEHFWLSWKVGGVVLLSGAILLFDVLFYLNAGSLLFSIVGFLGLWALLFWAAAQIYLFPMAFAFENPSLRRLLRNAGSLVLAYPLFALGIAIVTVLATALSVLLLAVLFATLWMPFVAVLCSAATRSSLQEVEHYRQRRAELDQERQKRDG
ncbi:MAG: DUF624 domain-containing protein [Anaerolineae bacterium]|nr:DUF624 domain-containing protein [Anaerolineae bacterium]